MTTALNGWYVTGAVLAHAERAAGETDYRRIEHGPYVDRGEAESLRDHYLYGPYDCREMRVRETTEGRDTTMRALLISGGGYFDGTMREFFHETTEWLDGATPAETRRWRTPGAVCDLFDDGEHPIGYVYVPLVAAGMGD